MQSRSWDLGIKERMPDLGTGERNGPTAWQRRLKERRQKIKGTAKWYRDRKDANRGSRFAYRGLEKETSYQIRGSVYLSRPVS